MCNPMAAMLVITAVSAAATAVQQKKAADTQEDYNAQQREDTIKAMNENMSQVELAKQQSTEQAGQKILENNMAAQKAMSTARVSAGENGVAGVSVDALLAELDGSRARYNDSVAANLKNSVDELNNQRTNVGTSARSTVNQLKTPQAPDYLGAALKIGSASASYYAGQNPSTGANGDASGEKFSKTGADVRARR